MTVLGCYRFVRWERIEDYIALGWQFDPQPVDHHHDYGVSLFWPGSDPPPEPGAKESHG